MEFKVSRVNRGEDVSSNQADPLVSRHLQEARALLRSRAYGPALELLTRLDRSYPRQVEILALRGMVLAGLGRDEEAEHALRHAADLQPGSLSAASDHAHVLLKLGRAEEALAALLDRLPPAGIASTDLPEAFNYNLGRANKACGRIAEAVLPLERTLAANPRHYAALVALGDVHKALGDTERAAGCFREAISINSADGTAWWSLSNLKAGRFSDAEFETLQQVARSATASEQQVYFDFALANGFDQRNQLDAAFAHYHSGNRRKRQQQKPLPWDRNAFSRWLRAIENAMDKVDVPARPPILPEPRPVFLVSLPRSGSTLTEQILSAHSLVTAAGELPWLPRLMTEETRVRPGGISHWLPLLDAGDWQKMGESYLGHCKTWYQDTPVFTDKLPGNIPFIGPILAMLPGALVVNIRRDPMDVCWSCYRQLFIGGADFACDLRDLAAYWKDHERHMAYWQGRASDRVLDLDYEKLVTQPEQEIRRLLAFLELPFEAACLSSHEAKRAVSTPSSIQVREAINTRGLGHWHRYERHLEELVQALAEVRQD